MRFGSFDVQDEWKLDGRRRSTSAESFRLREKRPAR
jgi:hypothetical protein